MTITLSHPPFPTFDLTDDFITEGDGVIQSNACSVISKRILKYSQYDWSEPYIDLCVRYLGDFLFPIKHINSFLRFRSEL